MKTLILSALCLATLYLAASTTHSNPEPTVTFTDPKGACCIYDDTTGEATCRHVTEALCNALGGTTIWRANEDCNSWDCIQLGTCVMCFTGICVNEIGLEECEDLLDGTWTAGSITSCGASLIPLGACCYDWLGEEVLCIEVTEECCELVYNSTNWYSGQQCSNDPCP